MPSFKQVECEPNCFWGWRYQQEPGIPERSSHLASRKQGSFWKDLLASFQDWPHGTVGWAWTSRSDAVVPWSWLRRADCTHLFPTPWSMTSYRQLEISHGGSIYTMEIGKVCKPVLIFSLEGQLSNINQHHTECRFKSSLAHCRYDHGQFISLS